MFARLSTCLLLCGCLPAAGCAASPASENPDLTADPGGGEAPVSQNDLSAPRAGDLSAPRGGDLSAPRAGDLSGPPGDDLAISSGSDAGTADYSQSFTTDVFTSAQTQWFAADAAKRTQPDNNYAYLPAHLDLSRGSPTLLLFFAGSGAKLDSYTNFMQEASNKGHPVIGLAYRNDFSHTALCGCFAKCMELMEEQNVNGDDNGFYPADTAQGIVPASNSVKYRLSAFLSYLTAHNSDGSHFDWSQFLSFDGAGNYLDPRWSKIVVAGHSGGGNMSTWILKNKAPIAALTFSAPCSNLHSPQPTNLTATPWAVGGTHGICKMLQSQTTLPDWITSGFGAHLMVYDDVRDRAYTTVWNGHNIPADVKAIGGLTELLFSDGGTPSGRWISRQTASTTCGGNNPHHSEVIANCSGLDAAGRYRHHGVWDYLLTTALAF